MTLEYDEAKNILNIKNHHISIPELATIFDNPFTAPTMDVPDVMHSDNRETRYHAYGWTTIGFYVMIWYCYRGEDVIRIIGGRNAEQLISPNTMEYTHDKQTQVFTFYQFNISNIIIWMKRLIEKLVK